VLGKYNEAIDAYKKSIILDPYDSTNQATRDAIERDQIKLGQPEKAIKTNDKAIKIIRMIQMLDTTKGVALHRLNKDEDAFKAFDKANELNPQNSKAWNAKKTLST